jgi:gamma-glutamyl phosphate reductase
MRIENSRSPLELLQLSGAARERLLLNPERIGAVRRGARDIASLADPVYETVSEWHRDEAANHLRRSSPIRDVGARSGLGNFVWAT